MSANPYTWMDSPFTSAAPGAVRVGGYVAGLVPNTGQPSGGSTALGGMVSSG